MNSFLPVPRFILSGAPRRLENLELYMLPGCCQLQHVPLASGL